MLILIMSVGAVCAADNITDDAIGDDSKEILETVQEDIATDDSMDILETTQMISTRQVMIHSPT